MSRLKKKLLLYFILIAIVSISVSAEIILEVSSGTFKNQILASVCEQLSGNIEEVKAKELCASIDKEKAFVPVDRLRDRMILLLLVISASIFGAFQLFTKDIVSPMDDMVSATKKIASGDLTVNVPVMSTDEIGQIGELINDMNSRLQNMITELRKEIDRHKENIQKVTDKIGSIARDDRTGEIIESRRMKVSDFKKMVDLAREVEISLDNMSSDLASLYTFVNMYKTYKTHSEISQDEIESAIRDFEERTGPDKSAYSRGNSKDELS